MELLRIQLKRTRGWRKPPGTIACTRPGPWGNEWTVQAMCDAGYGKGLTPREQQLICVEAHEAWVMGRRHWAHGNPTRALPDFRMLRGLNLGCWCHLCPEHTLGKPFSVRCEACDPCHTDTLGRLANGLA